MKRFVFVLAACLLVAGASVLAGCQSGGGNGGSGGQGDAQGEGQQGGKLVAAMELAYPPFETKDNDGAPTGVSVDIAFAIGEYLGLEVEIVDTAWDGLIPSLQTGKADFVISSMTITEKRKEEVSFSDPYANAYLAILANKGSGIESIDDLNMPGRKVAVKTGSTGFFYAEENLPEVEVIGLPDESACVTEVAQGKADGFLYDQLTIYRNNRNNPDTTSAVFIPFQDVEHWGIAVGKDNTWLLEEINSFIAGYYSEGGFDRLTEKYLKEEKEAFDEFGFKWFFDLG
ncbi:MAG: transporter substrate-binding domain-containing protein [Clostridiales bacterium]|nr:transporter substrate-binding domain-containing protein [Clostridiales bacterium]